jgi:beta-galactosidase GanA
MALLAACSCAVALQAQEKERPIPQIVKKDGRYALMVDGAPYLMLGAQAHNSSGWPGMLPKVWPAIQALHANTLEIPIYWEQFEPKPGQFDYSVIDAIVTQAREHHVRLDLLWFGTWKNGSQHYMPEWMKSDPVRYFHLIDKNGHPADSPSPFCTASQELDIRAFTAFMRHLKAFDPQRTVIIVQVENEAGTWGPVRDYAPAAQKLFDGPVPPDVLKAMGKLEDSHATWQQAFGSEAEVNFHAWAVAAYVGKVAAAGKAVYPLPLYANAALRDPLKPGAPGSYESGGPTDNVIPIWKAAAPALDIVSPDIYMNDAASYLKVLELYRRDDNPLFVPETIGGASHARFFFSALGLQAIGFSPVRPGL